MEPSAQATGPAILMTAEQFQSLGNLYERAHAENRELTRLSQAAQTLDKCDGLVAENARAWLRCMHCHKVGHFYRNCHDRLQHDQSAGTAASRQPKQLE